jgi:DNA-binding transcriptional LysR family regulator
MQYHGSSATASPVPFPARTPWPGVELRHLVALQAVVSAGSFNAAAARLGYTQSAVSAQIRSLERLTGVRVLERSRGARSLALTREGAILLRYATEIVARFEAVAAHLVGGPPSELRVGSFRGATAELAAPALARLGRTHPDLAVALVEPASEDALLELLRSDELDLAFAVGPVPPPLGGTLLRREGWIAILAPDDELAGRQALELRDLAGRRILVDSTAQGMQIARAASAQGATQVTAVDGAGLAEALGAAGVGVALVPELAHAPGAGAAAVPLRGDLPPRPIVLAWHEERPRTLAAQQFLRAVAAVAGAQRAPEAATA